MSPLGSESVRRMSPVIAASLVLQVLAGCNAARTVTADTSTQPESFGGTGVPADGMKASARIHGGQVASPGQFKSTVLIHVKYYYQNTWKEFDKGSDDLICTGTIISRRWILTAAHCLPCHYFYNKFHEDRHNVIEDVISVTVGCPSSDNTTRCMRYEVDWYTAHDEAYTSLGSCSDRMSQGINVDVGLLRLKEDIVYNDHVNSTALMSGPMPDQERACIAQGFGVQYYDPNTGHITQDGQLHYVNLTAGNVDYCNRFNFKDIRKVEDFHVCTHNPKDSTQMSCGGDSGSALLCKAEDGDVISVGVLSTGQLVRCGSIDIRDEYISTGHVEDWIKATTQDPRIVFKSLQ